MVLQNFALRASLYVNPVELVDSVLDQIKHFCHGDQSISQFDVSSTGKNGRIILHFVFKAEGLDEAEAFAEESLHRISSKLKQGEDIGMSDEQIREGSNLLTFA